MTRRRVVVKGGGRNLYFISEASGWVYVYHGSVWSGDTQIGKVRSVADALSLIKSHSGKDIESVGT